MKKLIAICLIILPIMAMAQKKVESVENFFKTYSDIPEYESMEVTEAMFEMFETMEDADPDMVEFLSKLKFVRYLEYQGSGGVTIGITNVSTPKGKATTTSNYYVDGKKVSTSVGGKSSGVATSTTNVKGGVANVSPISNISSSIVYDRAKEEIDLSGWTQLMKTNQDGEKMVFLKREWSSEDKEFLMLNGNIMINIRGDVNIMHLYQLEEILSDIGDILEFLPY